MRNIAILGQGMVIAFVHWGLAIPLPLFPMGVAILFLVLANSITRLRMGYAWPVTEIEFFAQLLLDVIALTALLYFSGGSTNPFVSLYLIPLIISAAALPWRYTWSMAAITVSCYTLLMNYFVPLEEQTFMLHIFAMWTTFVFSTVLIALFVVKMSESIRERDILLAKAREDALRNERIVALGTFAAGAAHELGTPLATMAVVCGELESEYAGDKALGMDLSILSAQIDNCKRILTGLLASAGEARAEGGRILQADEFVEKILEQWRLVRPAATHTYRKPEKPAPTVLAEQTLSQAILNLLNNAADASPESIEIDLDWNDSGIFIEILDRGPGLTPEAAASAGKPFFSTKPAGEGFGIGLFLANASIERMGGKVHLFNRDGGGTATRVILPVKS
ncbi:MAG: sensor histidine kinase [Burkholderiales bacterium]|nr:sensor histidine kinase [Burkholderiales bacterium]